MTSLWILYACGTAVIAGGLVAGVFLTFSDFVMKALNAASAQSGIDAIQIINRKVYGSVFIILLLGMVPVSLFLGGYALVYLSGPAFSWITAGSMIYLAGVFLVTIVCNVPMNKKLDLMDHTAAETASYWLTYGSSWPVGIMSAPLRPPPQLFAFLLAVYS